MKKKTVAVFNDTRRTSHYGCEFVMSTLIAELQARDIEPAFFWPMGFDWRGNDTVEKQLATVDGIIVNGEGSIHHSNENDRAVYLSEIAKFFKSKKQIPCYLINSTVYELDESVYENLKHFDHIYVRESMSKKLLEQHGISATYVPDLSFMASRAASQKPRKNVLATDSVYSEITKGLIRIAGKKGWDYSKLVHSCRPTLKDHWPLKEYARRHLKWVYASLVGKNTRNRYSFLDYLSSHELLCTGRFHAVTLALATHTPFLAVESNTPKISYLVEDVFGVTDRVANLTVIEKISDPSQFKWSADERTRVNNYLDQAHDGIQAMFNKIAATI